MCRPGNPGTRCAALGIQVQAKGRASKEPYIAALRDYHWRKDHHHEPLPAQVMPMLLGSWEDLDATEAEAIENDHHAWIVQPKMDGVRSLLHVEKDGVRITSRTVSEVTYRLSEFQDNLPHLATGLSSLTGTILDGELICPVSCLNTGSTITGTSLQATMAILATSPENSRRIQEGQDAQVRFHVFDILRYGGQDVTRLSLMERQDILGRVFRQSNNSFVETVPSFVVNKTAIHDRIISTGGEGTVWKKVDAPYESGRRVGHWIKRKRGIEIEAFVTGFKPGTNGHANVIGALEFSARNSNGESAPVAWVSNWNDIEREAMTGRDAEGIVQLRPIFLGRKAMILGQDESAKSRRLRHARIVRWMDS